MTTWQYTPYAWVYFVTAMVSLLMTYFVWKLRPSRGATFFGLMTLSTCVWTMGYILSLLNTNLEWKHFFICIEYTGIIGTNYFWILFALVYIYHDQWVTRKIRAFLLIVPTLTLIQVITLKYHTFFYSSYGLGTKNGLIVLQKIYGLGFYLWMAYAYFLILLGAIILVLGILRMPDWLRHQGLAVIASVALLLVSNISFVTGNNPVAPFDPTSITFAFVGVLLWSIVRRYGFLSVVPVAHNLVFKNVESGVVITDERLQILDLNPAAEHILNCKSQDALGKNLDDVFPAYQKLSLHLHSLSKTETNIEIQEETHIYEIQLTAMRHSDNNPTGFILMFYDITQRKQLEEQQSLLIGELQSTLNQVKTLNGLLPICASCKKIRDDAGYWHQVESYISRHSRAEFTHGLCPECMAEVYPDYFKNKRKPS